jgi:hypothetical protein
LELTLPYDQHVIRSEARKEFPTRQARDSYIDEVLREYDHLFTETNPVVPDKYAKYFMQDGVLLPGYRLEDSEEAAESEENEGLVLDGAVDVRATAAAEKSTVAEQESGAEL